MFDIVITPDVKLIRITDNQAAAMAQDMLTKLRAAMPVLDWHGGQRHRMQAMARIWDMLYKDVSDALAEEVSHQECNRSRRHAPDCDSGGERIA